MSLARTLMNGGSFGTSIDPSKYTHDMGATRIAMESVEELHEIFIESFYNVEQAELAAATEGVELIGSDYEVVAEASVGNAFTKIKEFLKKLWEKVKAWFHQVKRFLDSLFMSGKEFVKKYKKDIETADKTLTDFSYTMYDYDNAKLNSVNKDLDIDATMEDIVNAAKKAETDAGSVDALKKYIEEDNLVKEYGNEWLSSKAKATDAEDFDEACFASFRNGATSKEDKEDIDVNSLSEYASYVEESKAKQIDSLISKHDKAYRKAIKEVENEEKTRKETLKTERAAVTDTDKNEANIEAANNAVKSAQLMSTGIARVQSLHNKYLNAWKAAIKERDTVYKQLIVAGMTNARKNVKKK